jgi:6-phosphogluconate dehydrogenase
VDDFINKLVPLLEKGDIIIDGGNSEYQDTTRRTAELHKKGILYVGSGVSGGEDGARYGPSLMPGGNPEAWPSIKNIFQVGDSMLERTFRNALTAVTFKKYLENLKNSLHTDTSVTPSF